MSNRLGIGAQAAIAAIAAAGVLAAVSVADAESQDATIRVEDVARLAFVPSEVTISVGDTVTWDWAGVTAPHNAASTNAVAADPEWETFATPLPSAGTHSRQFNAVGEYTFVCDAHSQQMTGKITVVEGPVDPTPTATPGATSTPSPTATATRTPTPTPTATAAAAAGRPTATPDHSRDTPAPTASASADRTAPTVTGVKLRGIRRGARVTFKLSEPATVTLRVQRTGNRRVLRTVRLQGRAGMRTVTVRGAKLARGRYVVRIEARDAAGNRSSLTRKTVRIGS